MNYCHSVSQLFFNIFRQMRITKFYKGNYFPIPS